AGATCSAHDRERLPAGFLASVRRHHGAGYADCRQTYRRQPGRPNRRLAGGRLYVGRQPGGAARHVDTLRFRQPPAAAAHWAAKHWQLLQRMTPVGYCRPRPPNYRLAPTHTRTKIMEWEIVIGLETHTQLSTESKIFSNSSTRFGAAPNTQANEVDMALPGTLPVMNKGAVERAIQFGLAVGAHIAPRSIFARKNYF